MTGDDDLRRRLRDGDPARAAGPLDPQQSRSAHEILERAMATADLHDTTTPLPDQAPRPGRRRLLAVGVAAAAVVAVGGGLALSGVLGGDDAPAEASTLALTAAPGDALGSCAIFSVDTLAAQPVALAGTVTAVSGDVATLDVSRWYAGGDADLVTVTSTQGGAALDGVDLVVGEDYLLTATDGVVSGCGYSGPASPELASSFDEAFGG